MKRLIFVVVLVAISACGSDSTAPAAPSPASVAGSWSGTFQGTQSTGSFILAVALVLNQSNSSVTGTWAMSGVNGTVSGTTTSTSFSGTFTWNGTTVSGVACTGTFAVAGAAGGNTLSWTSPAVTGNCSNLPTAVTIAAQIR